MDEQEHQVAITIPEEEESADAWELASESVLDILFNIGKFKNHEMDMLVMNFFIIKELPIVAEAFHRESGCPLGIEDLSLLETQSTVRNLLSNQRFDKAIDLINQKLGPAFLDNLPRLKFRIDQQKMIELCRNRGFEAALEFSHKFVKWLEEEDGYIKDETQKTLVLMMFTDDTKSPVDHLLDNSRRDLLAKDVVKNMIVFQGRETENLIEKAMRMLRMMIQQDLRVELAIRMLEMIRQNLE